MKAELHCGDCLEVMKNIKSNSIDLILADLPYGTTRRNKWDIVIPFESLWGGYERIIKDNGVIALFGDEPFASKLRLSNEKLYRYDWVWIKSNPTGFLNAKKMPLKNTETISIFYKKLPLYNPQMRSGKPYVRKKRTPSLNYGKADKNTITINHGTRYPVKTINFKSSSHSSKTFTHPTQKPVDLLEYIIKTYTNEGMTVLDNVMGSGSTGVAAIDLKRNFIGIEKEPKFYQFAEQRIMKAKQEILLV